ncbi:MAG: HAMP domain-containing histidine kinase [Spirochaetia bacterium]|jgi:signal transduction histidine kinase|nr:HAMP domain-containing histidine kinase [Spirochaetia bacterium]
MRRFFVRVFLTIAGIALLVLLLSTTLVFFAFRGRSTEWGEQAYEMFCDKMAKQISSAGNYISFNQFVDIAYELANYDDRISGLLFRDSSGRVVFSAGTTSDGKALGQRKIGDEEILKRQLAGSTRRTNFLEGENLDPSTFKTVEVSEPVTILNMGYDLTNQFQVYLSASYGILPSRTLEMPSMVKAGQIAGSLMICTDSYYSFSVDVLTYTPDTYGNTGELVHYVFGKAIAAGLLSLVLALLLSFFFSRKNQKYVGDVEKSLKALADGKEDVTLPKTKVEEFKQINAAVEDLGKSLSLNRANRRAWLRNISHDMNTPVTSMRLLVDGMLDGMFPMDKHIIGRLSTELNDLSGRINRVREYAGLQSPDRKASPEGVDAADFMHTLLLAYKNDEKRVEVTTKSEVIDCDPELMSRAMKELLDNALAATKGKVTVLLDRRRIEVSNEGSLPAGIDFFEPWERGDKGRTSGGNGLGLSIVSQVMRLHGGTAEIKSEEGKVTVYLAWPEEKSSSVPVKSRRLKLPSA